MQELTKNIRIKEAFDKLYLNERLLTAGQMDFIRGCKRQFMRNKELSDKQTSILFEIAKCLKT